jgi:aminoglycoside 2''-phosphotransferase
VDVKQAVSEIESQTGIKARKVRRIVAGWEYIVIEVNDEIVFRIPRSQNRARRLQKEVALVGAISERISTPIPRYEFVSLGDGRVSSFAGYRRLGGLPCTGRNYRTSWTAGLATDLGRFLSELHSVRLPSKVAKDVETFAPKDWVARFRKFHAEARKLAYPMLSPVGQRESEKTWTELLENLQATGFQQSLIHGDLMGGNILCDPASRHLVGVLDWSDVKVSDPAYDFAGLLSVDRGLAESALRLYRHGASGLLKRAELYFRTIPTREIAWGVKEGYKPAVKIGLSEFVRWILQPAVKEPV